MIEKHTWHLNTNKIIEKDKCNNIVSEKYRKNCKPLIL